MRGVVLLVLALLAVGSLGFLLKGKFFPEAKPVVTAPPPEKSGVLVARMDIPAGTFIVAEQHLTWDAREKSEVKPGNITEENTSITSFSGAVARVRIESGREISNDMIVKPDDGGFMAAVVSPGKRAISIAVTPTSGNAGFIFPGDQVDIILSRRFNSQFGGSPQNLSDTIVRDVRVLAVDQKYKADPNQIVLAKTVTLEVSPEQAEIVNTASDVGRLSLSLVSVSNKIEKLINEGSKEAEKPSATSDKSATDSLTREILGESEDDKQGISFPHRMTIIKGDEITEQEFIMRRK